MPSPRGRKRRLARRTLLKHTCRSYHKRPTRRHRFARCSGLASGTARRFGCIRQWRNLRSGYRNSSAFRSTARWHIDRWSYRRYHHHTPACCSHCDIPSPARRSRSCTHCRRRSSPLRNCCTLRSEGICRRCKGSASSWLRRCSRCNPSACLSPLPPHNARSDTSRRSCRRFHRHTPCYSASACTHIRSPPRCSSIVRAALRILPESRKRRRSKHRRRSGRSRTGCPFRRWRRCRRRRRWDRHHRHPCQHRWDCRQRGRLRHSRRRCPRRRHHSLHHHRLWRCWQRLGRCHRFARRRSRPSRLPRHRRCCRHRLCRRWCRLRGAGDRIWRRRRRHHSRRGRTGMRKKLRKAD